MKIITVLGARPQFVKAATISRAIKQHNKKVDSKHYLDEVIVHTGQHFDANMSQVFFDQLDIPHPDYNLGVANLSHGAMTGKMLGSIEELVLKEKPDWLLVYGDTNSTLAGALSAIKLQIPIIHIEAGLRSYNPNMPEEINRILTDRISTILFCPTQNAVENLLSEGFPYLAPGSREQIISNVGDVMFDAVLYYRDQARKDVSLQSWDVEEKEYVLCTLHRQENTDDPVRLEGILSALREISNDSKVLLPLHPRTRKMLGEQKRLNLLDGLQVLDPVPYIEMQRLEMGANLILTDSGGMQKEAFFHGVPCITLRDETEWVETVDLGWNYVVGAQVESIIRARDALKKPPETKAKPYGDGSAASKIISIINECS